VGAFALSPTAIVAGKLSKQHLMPFQHRAIGSEHHAQAACTADSSWTRSADLQQVSASEGSLPRTNTTARFKVHLKSANSQAAAFARCCQQMQQQ
jgi:hypothetical protein